MKLSYLPIASDSHRKNCIHPVSTQGSSKKTFIASFIEVLWLDRLKNDDVHAIFKKNRIFKALQHL